MKEFVEKLKAHLKENKNEYIEENDWMGDTVSGFYTETTFDFEKLNEEIDAFCASFVKEEK